MYHDTMPTIFVYSTDRVEGQMFLPGCALFPAMDPSRGGQTEHEASLGAEYRQWAGRKLDSGEQSTSLSSPAVSFLPWMYDYKYSEQVHLHRNQDLGLG